MNPGGHPSIVVFDRDPSEGTAMAAYLNSQGLRAETCEAVPSLFRRVEATPPNLLLLHWMGGPVSPALEVVSQVRAVADVPCVLRARQPDSADDRVAGLENGMDDWISADVTSREVVARIRAVLRRAGPRDGAAPAAMPSPPRPDAAANGKVWRLSPQRRELYDPDGEPLALTSAEFDFLHALAQQRGLPVSREALSQAVFHRPWYPQDRGIDNVAARLRRKLSAKSRNPQVIKPVRSVGYAFTGF
ncbi:response regulator transcription factor [Muricoccus radiodurans]|uniref:response regulator transcription factor n=1 Tax=Muricoccus radiodurans TaxID=2231721 RepID=UPI003CE778A1